MKIKLIIDFQSLLMIAKNDWDCSLVERNTVNTGVQAALADKLHLEFSNLDFGKRKFEGNYNKSKVES